MPAARSIAPMDDPSKLTEVLGRMNAQIYLKEVGSKTTHKMRGHGSRIPVSRSILEKRMPQTDSLRYQVASPRRSGSELVIHLADGEHVEWVYIRE